MTTQTKPIELYYASTPNGRKITIMLEELGVPYTLNYVHLSRGDQLKPEFLNISPNNKIPAIVDPEGPGGQPLSVFESGAILQYLGEKFGRFYPADRAARVKVNEWLFWQMAGFGPMLGQTNHFLYVAPVREEYATKRFLDETHRLYRVLNTQLQGRQYVAGEYSIADIAIFAWTDGYERQKIDLNEFPNVEAWRQRILARPAVQKAMAIKPPPRPADQPSEEESRKLLFNQR